MGLVLPLLAAAAGRHFWAVRASLCTDSFVNLHCPHQQVYTWHLFFPVISFFFFYLSQCFPYPTHSLLPLLSGCFFLSTFTQSLWDVERILGQMKCKRNLDFVSGFSGVLTKSEFPWDWAKLTKGGKLDSQWKDRYFSVEISLQSSSCKCEEKYICIEFAQAFPLKWSNLILFKVF